MSVTVRETSGRLVFHWWWEALSAGRLLDLVDRDMARALLRRLGAAAGGALPLRRFVAERLSLSASPLEDAAVFDQIAHLIVTGKIRVVAQALSPLALSLPAREASEAPAGAWDARPAPEPEPSVEEPPTFPEDIDAVAIAAAKREAARDGVPFCEECTRKKLARQREAATFPEDIDAVAIAKAQREAARLGVPFCEECMKKRLKRERALSAGASG